MTPEQITHDREEMLKALTDPTHPWHKGALLLPDVATASAEALAFLRKVAPYAFEETGEPLAVNAVDPVGGGVTT